MLDKDRKKILKLLNEKKIKKCIINYDKNETKVFLKDKSEPIIFKSILDVSCASIILTLKE